MVLITYLGCNLAIETINLLTRQMVIDDDSITIFLEDTKTENHGAVIQKNFRNCNDIDIVNYVRLYVERFKEKLKPDGKFFGIEIRQFERTLKNEVKLISDDYDRIAPHSIRLGVTQELVESGCNEPVIKSQGNWKSNHWRYKAV
jgi:hypothetical protein